MKSAGGFPLRARVSGTDLVIVRDYSALALGVGYAWILVSFEGLLLR